MTADRPCLVLDGSARHGVRVGVLADGRWVGQGLSAEGPLEAVFDCVGRALGEAGLGLDDMGSFAVCVGPGSVLGIRISCLAVRSWAVLRPRPVFVWRSLDALAQSALAEGVTAPFAVAQPSRLKRWNCLRVGADGLPASVDELSAEELALMTMPVLSDEAAINTVSSRARLIEHPWALLPAFFAREGFLRVQEKPDALNPAADFALWSGERHRGPAA